MSFLDKELSIFGGSPVELYEFTVPGAAWRYTTDDRITVFNGADYMPVSDLKRGSIKVSTQAARTPITIRMRGNAEIADQFRVSAPSSPVALTIFKKHRTDADFVVRWKGRVSSCQWVGDFANFTCSPISSTMKQPGLRRAYQYQCPYALYDTKCRVDRSAYEVFSEVSSIAGSVIGVVGVGIMPAQYFWGGYILWETVTGRQETRMIMQTAGDLLTLQNATVGLALGDVVRLYPGCDHTIKTCYDTFANADRYGGFPLIPKINPFGSTIY